MMHIDRCTGQPPGLESALSYCQYGPFVEAAVQ
jgi:hypothetical protein